MSEWGMITVKNMKPILWSHSGRPILHESRYVEAKKELTKIASQLGYEENEILLVSSKEIYPEIGETY